MSFTKFSCEVPENEELRAELVGTLEKIVRFVADACGKDPPVRLTDIHSVAFGGTEKEPEKVLSLEWQKCFGKPALVASFDDKYMWQEWDFGTRENLVARVEKFIVSRIKGE